MLYEVITIIFAILMLIYFKQFPSFKPGMFLGLFFVLVFTARFFIEFVKEDQVGFEEGMALNMGQWLSIPFVIFGLYRITSYNVCYTKLLRPPLPNCVPTV